MLTCSAFAVSFRDEFIFPVLLPCTYMQIWTSQLKRTVQTAKHLTGTVEQWKALNELDVVGAPPNILSCNKSAPSHMCI